MVRTEDYDDMFQNIAPHFFISAIYYVTDLASWSRQKGVGLSEPAQPMKLFTEGKRLMMFLQSEIEDQVLDNLVRALSVRWTLRDNVMEPSSSLNSTKKRLAFCFLKEYARTLKEATGDETLQDQWTIREMERLGFFRE
jgi:hypothetical protein